MKVGDAKNANCTALDVSHLKRIKNNKDQLLILIGSQHAYDELLNSDSKP